MKVLGVFARHPIPGAVKTRLAQDLGPQAAARVYEACLNAVLELTLGIADERVIAFSPTTAEARTYFDRCLANRKDSLWAQPDAPLGERLKTFVDACGRAERRLVVIGSDSPTLPSQYVREAFTALETRDVVLGPAWDGGYYLIGMRAAHGELFEGIEWSSPRVLSQTVERICAAGLSLHLLPPWYDVDGIDSFRFLQAHLKALQAAGRPVPQNLLLACSSADRMGKT